MSTHRFIALALASSMALSACAYNEPVRTASTGAASLGSRDTDVVPNNGLCGAQYGVPMERCDLRHPAVLGHDSGGIDYQGFPYNLRGGGG